MDSEQVLVNCYDRDCGEAFFFINGLGESRGSKVSVDKINNESGVEESQESVFRSFLRVSASAFRMTARALSQSPFEIVLLPTVSLSFSGRFMPRLITSEKLSPGSFALLRSWYTSSEMAIVLAMIIRKRDFLYICIAIQRAEAEHPTASTAEKSLTEFKTIEVVDSTSRLSEVRRL